MNDDFKNYIQLLIDNKDKIIHLPEKDIHNLLDYITNLQQENERLKLELSGYREAILRDDKLLGLQQRIEKAVDYIKELISATKGTLNDMNYCDKKETITQYVESLEYDINHYEYLLNILNGRSDE